jgi:hypothetical protein
MRASFGRKVLPSISTDRAVDVAGTSTGAILAGTVFTGFTNPAGSVFDVTNWTTGAVAKRNVKATATANAVLTSDDSGRDVEVTTWTRQGTVFLRVADGRAIYFNLNLQTSNGTLIVGVCTGLTFGSIAYGSNYTGTAIYTNAELETVAGVADFNTTEDHEWTFGADGFEVYAKFNGVEFFRQVEARHLVSGQVALQHNSDALYGYRDVTLNWLPHKIIYSHGYPANKTIDVRDLGCKSLRTKGSMGAASATLTLTHNPGFEVGDQIIVAVGGEPGAAARGTEGVGGTWPELAHDDSTERNADTSQANNTFAWDRSNGNVYRYATSGTTWSLYTLMWYTNKAIPRALVTTITAVSGNVLTLDDPSVAATTNADVFFDCEELFGDLTQDATSIAPDNIKYFFPQGEWAFSNRLRISTKTSCEFFGEGQSLSKIISPDGVDSIHINAQSVDHFTIRDLHLYGNWRVPGFGLGWANGAVTEIAVSSGNGYPGAVRLAQCDYAVMQDCTITDVAQKAFGVDDGVLPRGYRLTAIQTDELRQYVQWHFQFAACTGGELIDCTFDAPYLMPCMEMFSSSDCLVQNFTATNGLIAINNSGGWTYDNFDLTYEANSQGPEGLAVTGSNNLFVIGHAGFAPDFALLNLGGTVTNMTVDIQGAINGSGHLIKGIGIASNNTDITITDSTFTCVTGAVLAGLAIDQNESGSGLVLTNITTTGDNTELDWGTIHTAADATLTNITSPRVWLGDNLWP